MGLEIGVEEVQGSVIMASLGRMSQASKGQDGEKYKGVYGRNRQTDEGCWHQWMREGELDVMEEQGLIGRVGGTLLEW